MKKSIILILISNRTDSASNVQKLLTETGCHIKTRLGLHQGVENVCSESGLIILEMSGQEADNNKLAEQLNAVEGVNAKIVHLEV